MGSGCQVLFFWGHPSVHEQEHFDLLRFPKASPRLLEVYQANFDLFYHIFLRFCLGPQQSSMGTVKEMKKRKQHVGMMSPLVTGHYLLMWYILRTTPEWPSTVQDMTIPPFDKLWADDDISCHPLILALLCRYLRNSTNMSEDLRAVSFHCLIWQRSVGMLMGRIASSLVSFLWFVRTCVSLAHFPLSVFCKSP